MAEAFSITPDYTWEPSWHHNVLKTTFETGKTQRRYKGAKPRQWSLVFKGKWTGHVASVVEFYEARQGSFEAFDWMPPGEASTITATFVESSLSVQRYGESDWAECSLTIEEVL